MNGTESRSLPTNVVFYEPEEYNPLLSKTKKKFTYKVSVNTVNCLESYLLLLWFHFCEYKCVGCVLFSNRSPPHFLFPFSTRNVRPRE